eukprot:scaffold20057_cov61-Phaeocystis_antarctica.AAC.3
MYRACTRRARPSRSSCASSRSCGMRRPRLRVTVAVCGWPWEAGTHSGKDVRSRGMRWRELREAETWMGRPGDGQGIGGYRREVKSAECGGGYELPLAEWNPRVYPRRELLRMFCCYHPKLCRCVGRE